VIVADTSAVVAILLAENDWPLFERQMTIQSIVLPATCLLEVTIVLASKRPMLAPSQVDVFLNTYAIALHAITADTVNIARMAFARFGKGRHKAALNFGDCFSYAVAIELGAPLLFKGREFAETDVRIAPLEYAP
jgi:ribonuclease VapC